VVLIRILTLRSLEYGSGIRAVPLIREILLYCINGRSVFINIDRSRWCVTSNTWNNEPEFWIKYSSYQRNIAFVRSPRWLSNLVFQRLRWFCWPDTYWYACILITYLSTSSQFCISKPVNWLYDIAVSTPSLNNSFSQNSQITYRSLNAIVAQSKDF
jgi:hypothetical protein